MTAEKEILATIVRRLGANAVLRLVRQIDKESRVDPTNDDIARAEYLLHVKGVKILEPEVFAPLRERFGPKARGDGEKDPVRIGTGFDAACQGRDAERAAEEWLRRGNLDPERMPRNHPWDFTVNGTRLDVKSSALKRGRSFKFGGLKDGRDCDAFLLVGVWPDQGPWFRLVGAERARGARVIAYGVDALPPSMKPTEAPGFLAGLGT